MKAFVRLSADNQIVQLVDTIAPVPEAGEIAVEVAAFGVGVHDRYFIPPNGPFPYTIGIEAAGIVDAVGAGVDRFRAGDRVMVSASMNPKGGTWAERVVVGPSGLTAMPDGLDFATAAGFPVIGGTAVHSVHALGLQAGETVYIAGASGAIGTLAVQMAVRAGARVAGSASPENHDYLRSLGAELAVDYHDTSWPDQVREWAAGGVDAALAIQPGTPASCVSVGRDGGRVITVSGDPCASERGVSVEQFVHRPDARAEIIELADDISSGRIRLVLEHVFDFADALTALEKTETRHARGKVVVTGPTIL